MTANDDVLKPYSLFVNVYIVSFWNFGCLLVYTTKSLCDCYCIRSLSSSYTVLLFFCGLAHSKEHRFIQSRSCFFAFISYQEFPVQMIWLENFEGPSVSEQLPYNNNNRKKRAEKIKILIKKSTEMKQLSKVNERASHCTPRLSATNNVRCYYKKTLFRASLMSKFNH